MKHLKYLFLFISLAVFASCSESDVEGNLIGDGKQATFSGTIQGPQSRVTGSAWDEGDAIGIFALDADQITVYDEKANVQHTTTGDGKFSPVIAGETISFPIDGSLDFVAYYPFNNELTGLEYTITEGSDPLFSNNAKGHNRETPNVGLVFDHMLSKMVLNIQLGENLTSLEGLAATINNVRATGTFNLSTGVTTLSDAQVLTPTVIFAGDNESATITELVMPTQDLQDIEILFTLGDNTYKWSPKTTMVLASNMEYVYRLALNIEAEVPEVLELGAATINEWGEGYTAPDFEGLDPEIDETPDASIVIDVETLTFAETGGSETISITANVDWATTSDAAWLTVSPENGSNDGTINATATANDGAERTANITISDGTITKTVTVTQSAEEVGEDFAEDLFFSEYIEGGSNNKYLEIYNGTGTTVDLSDYRVELYANGATTATNTEVLEERTLENGEVLVLKHGQSAIYTGEATVSATTNYNGDDAIALIKISTGNYIDIIGRIGEQVKWSAGGNLSTENKTLVRKPTIRVGVTENPASGFPTLATEWIGYPQDTVEYLGSHTMN